MIKKCGNEEKKKCRKKAEVKRKNKVGYGWRKKRQWKKLGFRISVELKEYRVTEDKQKTEKQMTKSKINRRSVKRKKEIMKVKIVDMEKANSKTCSNFFLHQNALQKSDPDKNTSGPDWNNSRTWSDCFLLRPFLDSSGLELINSICNKKASNKYGCYFYFTASVYGSHAISPLA